MADQPKDDQKTLENAKKALESAIEDVKSDIRSLETASVSQNANPLSDQEISKSRTMDNSEPRPNSFRLVHRGTNYGTDYSNHFGVHVGKVYLDGVEISETVGSEFSYYPNSFEVTATTYGWIDLDESTNPATWIYSTGASLPTAAANHTIIRMFKLTWSSSGPGRVVSGERYRSGDVFIKGGGSPTDPAATVTIGGTTEGAEAAEATAKTFNDTNGLKFYAMTRVGYYDAGNKTLYGYVRELRFTSKGQLYLVSAETRVEIDVPVAETI